MAIRKLLTAFICFMLLACGGEVSVGIGYHSGGNADDSDLLLTVRVDEGLATEFITRVDEDGATISLDSGQRLRITADEPTVLTLDADEASIDLISSSSTVWEGIISSPVNTSLTFRFASVYYPGDVVFLKVDVRP